MGARTQAFLIGLNRYLDSYLKKKEEQRQDKRKLKNYRDMENLKNELLDERNPYARAATANKSRLEAERSSRDLEGLDKQYEAINKALENQILRYGYEQDLIPQEYDIKKKKYDYEGKELDNNSESQPLKHKIEMGDLNHTYNSQDKVHNLADLVLKYKTEDTKGLLKNLPIIQALARAKASGELGDQNYYNSTAKMRYKTQDMINQLKAAIPAFKLDMIKGNIGKFDELANDAPIETILSMLGLPSTGLGESSSSIKNIFSNRGLNPTTLISLEKEITKEISRLRENAELNGKNIESDPDYLFYMDKLKEIEALKNGGYGLPSNTGLLNDLDDLKKEVSNQIKPVDVLINKQLSSNTTQKAKEAEAKEQLLKQALLQQTRHKKPGDRRFY